jgi:hypothetical protein
VFAAGEQHAYAVGDGGLVLDVDDGGTPVRLAGVPATENLLTIWASWWDRGPELWLAGAGGALVHGLYYPPQP